MKTKFYTYKIWEICISKISNTFKKKNKQTCQPGTSLFRLIGEGFNKELGLENVKKLAAWREVEEE